MNEPGLIRSMGKQKLAKMVEIQEYPRRVKFNVSIEEGSMLSNGTEAKIKVHGVRRNDKTEHFFNIDLPTLESTKPNQHLQLQMTGTFLLNVLCQMGFM